MKVRNDIQALRGVAVLAVLLFHAFPTVAPHGLLGVDVFFVISGFLIGRMILQGQAEGSFRFGGFYLRRARRLLPASLMTLSLTTLGAYLLLTQDQWRDYLGQVAGALTFTTNFVLAWQSGYFDSAAETKPLLHMWSLAVEEQFYFVLPIALVLFRRWWIIALFALLSLGLCVTFASGLAPVGDKSAATLAFYMLPTRAWELLAGVLAGWLMMKRPVRIPFAVKWVALAGLIALFFVSFDPVHPRGSAIAATLLTTVLLLGSDGWMPRNPVMKVGDWSYSLYLVHWPLLAFATVAYTETPPVEVRVALLAASFVLAWLQYSYVEQPLRHSVRIRVLFGWIAAIAVAATPGLATAEEQPTSPAKGLSSSCDHDGPRWVDRPECRSGDTVALWGDSYAMHLAPALGGFVQMTKASCGPLPGVAVPRQRYPLQWTRDCNRFNQSVFEALLADDRIKTVIISSPFAPVLEDRGQQLLVGDTLQPWSPVGRERLLETVRALRAAGKDVLIVGPTPRANFNAGACNQRLTEGRPLLGRADCDIPRAGAEQAVVGTVATLRHVAAETGARLVLPFDTLCGPETCRTRIGDTALYRDEDHLTPPGAKLILGSHPLLSM